MAKIIIDVDDETGHVQILDGGFSLVEVLGFFELAKHIITHSDSDDEYELGEEEKSLAKKDKGFMLGKKGDA